MTPPLKLELISRLPAAADTPAQITEAVAAPSAQLERLQADLEQLREEVAELRRQVEGLQQGAGRA